MNGALTKPLHVARLHEVFERFGLVRLAAPAANVEPTGPAAPIDVARLDKLTAGDSEFALELTLTFTASGEQAALRSMPRPQASTSRA